MGTAKERRPEKQPVAAQPLAVAGIEEAVQVGAPQKPLLPSQCRKHLRKTVAAAYRDIVAGFVDQAKGGGCQHLKMATEVVESKARVRASRVKGPAALMLEELERAEELEKQAQS